MQKYFSSLVRFIRTHVLATVVAAIVIVGGIWFFFGRTTDSGIETMVIHPGDFAEQISVSGNVVAAKTIDLGFSQSGRIAAVFAAVGDKVLAGKVLASIDNGDLKAAVLQKEAALETAQAVLESLQQGTRPEGIAVKESDVASDQAALDQANGALVDAIKDAYTTSDDAVRNKVDQFFANPRTNPTITVSIADQQLKSVVELDRLAIENILDSWQASVGGLHVAGDLPAATAKAQANLAEVAKLLTDANAALNAAIPSQSVSQTTLSGYIASVGTARTNVNGAVSALTSAVTGQKSAAAALDTAEKNLALAKAGPTQADIDAQSARVKAAEADVASAEADLAKTLIVAPFAGMITKVDAKVGAVVSPNIPEISVISDGTFQIESFVPEVNIAKVNAGDAATVTLDAYGPATPFSAKVILVDPAETVRDGVSTYKTTLAFPGPDPRIRSGMTANVVITTDEKPNAIVIPRGAIFDQQGKTFVQVQMGSRVVNREVQLGGVSSLGKAEITSGLADGDLLVLNPKH